MSDWRHSLNLITLNKEQTTRQHGGQMRSVADLSLHCVKNGAKGSYFLRQSIYENALKFCRTQFWSCGAYDSFFAKHIANTDKQLDVILPAFLHRTELLHHKIFKAGVNVKAVLRSLNTAFLPISQSRFKRHWISLLISLTTVGQFCVNFWVIFGHFGKEIFFLKG